MKAILALESGRVFTGSAFGADTEGEGEVVFNTSMTGYQEILTDPSYRGQMVAMTYPLIGNYGINRDDVESRKVFLGGFIVKELSSIVSNWRATHTLGEYLKEEGVIGIEGVDTRALTVHLRESGAQRGIISTRDLDPQSLVSRARKVRDLVGVDLVKEVIVDKPFRWNESGKYRIAAIDSGIKFNILRNLEQRDCQVTVYPATATAEAILKDNPDGIFLSNGPGDPAVLGYLVGMLKAVLGKLPVFGICLGHQVLAQALGGSTFKLKFGHHGGNHPVMDLDTRGVAITAQNHGFAVNMESFKDRSVRLTHVNLNDQTCEGIEHKGLNAFSVQYHPEAAPGPHDAGYLFDKFIKNIQSFRK